MTHTIRGTEPANSQPRPSWLWPTPWSVRTQDCVSFNVFIFGFLSTAPTPAAFCCCPLLSWPHSGSWTLQLLPWSLLMQPRFDNHVNPCPSVNTKIYRGLGTGRVFWSPWEQELWVSLKLWCKINLIPTRSKGKGGEKSSSVLLKHVDKSAIWNQYLLCTLLRKTDLFTCSGQQNVAQIFHLPFLLLLTGIRTVFKSSF